MTEPVREPEVDTRRTSSFVGALPPTAPDDRLVRRNVLLGLALFGVFVALFFGTILVALIYLAVAD
jgi:hypothetical protein